MYLTKDRPADATKTASEGCAVSTIVTRPRAPPARNPDPQATGTCTSPTQQAFTRKIAVAGWPAAVLLPRANDEATGRPGRHAGNRRASALADPGAASSSSRQIPNTKRPVGSGTSRRSTSRLLGRNHGFNVLVLVKIRVEDEYNSVMASPAMIGCPMPPDRASEPGKMRSCVTSIP